MEYVLILVWIGFMALVAKSAQFKRAVLVEGVEKQRYLWLFAFVVFVPIIWMAGHRPTWFSDTYNYTRTFLDGPSSFSDLWSFTNSFSKDKAYFFFSGLMRILLGSNRDLYFTILATIQGISVLSVFRKYSSMYILSIFFFVASADYIWMFNGIRQFTAVTIIFAATALILKKKIIPFVFVVLFASLFHQTALIMIPIFLITLGEAWNKRTITFIILILIAIIFIGEFTSFLDESLAETQYASAGSFINSSESKGTNPFRVAFFSIPAGLSFLKRKEIKAANNNLINICVNMSFVSAGIYFISMFTSGMLIARLPIYISLYSYILLPWIIERAIAKEKQKIVIAILIVTFLVFYYFQMHISWNLF